MKNNKEKKVKKKYVAPRIEYEYYKLDANIASNCATVVSNGPQMGKYSLCNDYAEITGDGATYSARNVYNVHFYEDTNCTCYNSSVGEFWTS